MKVVYARRALRDIDEILAYLQKQSPRGANSVSLAIEYTIGLCALNPRAASKTDEPGVYPLGRYRYTVFYRILSDETGIEIARVIHSARVKNLGMTERLRRQQLGPDFPPSLRRRDNAGLG